MACSHPMLPCVSSSLRSLRFAGVVGWLLMVSAPAWSAENGGQRYSPGVGGSDMTSPLVPGLYVQAPLVLYHASKIKGADGQQATSAIVNPATGSSLPYRAKVGIQADTYAVLPRLTYLSAQRLMGANVGFTVMLPLVQRSAEFTGTAQFPSGTNPSLQAQVQSGVTANADKQAGRELGIGDIEVSPVLHWEIGDHQTVTLAPTLVLPSGAYDPYQRVNPGYGNFFTFRPSVQYAFIGEGWDLGGRSVLSFNTRNKGTGYYSGNMFNLDYQAMAFVTEDVRVGLQGYFVRQLSNDTQNLDGFSASDRALLAKEMVDGNKTSVNGLGPAVGWLRNGGEFLLEGKLIREFGARNRTEGNAFWLTLSKPL